MFTLWKRKLRSTQQDLRGAQIVEFAIVVPILLLLVIGIIDFGRAYFSWVIITNGAREGARVAAVGGDQTAVQDRVTSAVSGLSRVDPPLDDCSLLPAGSEQEWCVETANLLGDPGEEAMVRVQYNFRFLVPGLANLTAGVFQLTAESTMRLEG